MLIGKFVEATGKDLRDHTTLIQKNEQGLWFKVKGNVKRFKLATITEDAENRGSCQIRCH